jgi:hypothetical protein
VTEEREYWPGRDVKLLKMEDPRPEGLATEQIREQRRLSCSRRLVSVSKDRDRLPDSARVAIVGYGPSLMHTWPDITGLEVVWTVSKAHDFLLDRGVAVTHHTDTDYREHKAGFIKHHARGVKYMIGTAVHPAYLDKLALADYVRLFHVDTVGSGMMDQRYLRVPPQLDAGMQAARLAFLLGAKEQHWFGFDYDCHDGATHAGPHEGVTSDKAPVFVGDRQFETTSLLLRGAFSAERMLCKHPHLTVTIHGGGMLRPFLLERARVAKGQVK